MTTARTARLVDSYYRDGYGRAHLDQRFCTVQCDACGIVLNSGHHYTDDARHFAEALADEHNELRHPPAPVSARSFAVGDEIPGHGVVIAVTLTAYQVRPGAVSLADSLVGGEACAWVPFYGERGVDDVGTVEGLVTFADGSRYGGRS